MAEATLKNDGAGEQELLYFGRVLAGQCHELVNALNIANELCGLQEDTLPRAREAQAGAVEKLGSLAGRIQAQIVRCNAIVRGLGHFAHSVDEPLVACEARDLVERAVFFAVRQARLRQTAVRAVLPEADVRPVYCSPFRVQRAIHAGIELFLEGTAPDHHIAVSLMADPAGALITIEGADPLPGNDTLGRRLAEVAALVQAGGGEMRDTLNRDPLLLLIPYSHRDATGPDLDSPAGAVAEVPDVD